MMALVKFLFKFKPIERLLDGKVVPTLRVPVRKQSPPPPPI